MNTLLNIDKNLHHENDKKNNSDLRHQLQLDYASENTFLSLLRTAGVLTGIAAILIRLKKQLVFVQTPQCRRRPQKLFNSRNSNWLPGACSL